MPENITKADMRNRIGSRWVWMSLVALFILTATYIALVRTYLGQYLENSALLGAQAQVTSTELADALENLNVISVTSLIVSATLFAVVGLLRRSWRIAFAGVFSLVTSVLLAEALKRYVLPRPNLADIYTNNGHNSFPSGHTTIAMGILVSLLLVFSYRWRGVVMFLAFGWAIGIGAAAVTARWHRLSDTVGADMIAIGVGALFALWLLRRNMIEPREEQTYPLRVIFASILGIAAAGSLLTGILLAVMTLNNFDVFDALRTPGVTLTAHLDEVFNANMFYAAQSLAFAFSALSGLWFWGTLHRLGTRSSSPAAPTRS